MLTGTGSAFPAFCHTDEEIDAGERYPISDHGLNMMDLVKKMYSP
jgi:hypothetical protein